MNPHFWDAVDDVTSLSIRVDDLNSANKSEGEDTGCYSDSKLQICKAVVMLIPAKVTANAHGMSEWD